MLGVALSEVCNTHLVLASSSRGAAALTASFFFFFLIRVDFVEKAMSSRVIIRAPVRSAAPHHEPEARCAPRRGPLRAAGGEIFPHMCVNLLKMCVSFAPYPIAGVSQTGLECQEQRNKRR